VVFIQVPFESESTSATEKQFGSCFELWNEASRQVHKTSVNIVCTHTQKLLVMQFRCLRVSGALHVMGVKKRYDLCENGLRGSLNVSVILIYVCFENIFL